MRYIGWFLLVLALVGGYLGYRFEYLPLKQENAEQQKEIAMWTRRVAELRSSPAMPGPAVTTAESTRSSHPTETFYQDDLFTDPASVDLKPAAQTILRRLAENLRKESGNILVAAHTDDVPVGPKLKGRFQTNWELGALRATAVVRFLESCGVGPNRLAATSFGAYRPIADNKTEDGKRKNRRIEIILR